MYFDFFVAKEWEYLPSASVQTVYKLYTDPSYHIDHHIIDSDKYIFFYTMDGRGSIQVGQTEYQAEPNSVFFANTATSLKYHCAADHWNFWLVEVKTDRLLFEANRFYLFPFRAEYHQLFARMLESLKGGEPLLTAALFQVFCSKLFQYQRTQLHAEDAALFSRCVSYMETHLVRFSLERFCEDTGISPRTINNLFRRTVDAPPYQYYQRLRTERSKEYLENTEMSIAQIAATLGFINSSHFSRVFKSHLGKTPLQYRTEFRLMP